MSEEKTENISTLLTPIPEDLSDSGNNSPTPTATTGDKLEKEDVDTVRGSKRRKNCPTALEKVKEVTPSNRLFTFSFDTKLSGFTPQFTPKFGSFNLGRDLGGAATTAREKDGCCQIPAIKETTEDDDGGAELTQKREADVALSSAD